MKYYILKEVVSYLQKYKSVTYISRVDDNLIRIDFDKDSLFFELTKGRALIYKRDKYICNKSYNAPFDIVLKNRFTKAKIEKIELLNDDKIIKIDTVNASAYKMIKTSLQLEFTGKITNAIILENDLILEALRHIDISNSYREIKPNKKLISLDKQDFKYKIEQIENIDEYLENVYKLDLQKKINSVKTQKMLTIGKKIKKFSSILGSLENEDDLLIQSTNASLDANIVLANLYKIKLYDKEIELDDFEGNKRLIKLPQSAKSVADFAKLLFDLSKRLKQKAKNINIERDNLQSKIDFFKRLKSLIENAKNVDEVEFYYPKQKRVKKDKKFKEFETFFIDGFKILIGRNEKENIRLLKLAKSNDTWLHIKDMPSSHVIIQSSKQNIPLDVIEQSAKLCVEFSTDKIGNYLVDYTKRKDVRIQQRADVLYYKYKTVAIKK